jgi:hypothetical protein
MLFKLNKIYTFFCLLVAIQAFSQNEGNIWYFGNNVGIDFNPNSAVALNNSAMQTAEGCASICDNLGNLLFYTDGTTVYNSNHVAMPNGLGLAGDNSSTQSAIIVKKPGSTHLYYVFTADAIENTTAFGIRYSIVDMNLQGGLGDVTSPLNTLVYAPSCEKLAAVQHTNGVDYWIITHEWESNSYNSHLLTATGLSSTPVLSSIGTYLGGDIPNAIGYLKANIDGTLIANACFGNDTVQVLDFDATSGVLTNPKSLPVTNPYGVEFSPASQYLYISGMTNVYQFDLLAGTQANINNSQINLDSISVEGKWALQLAPDHRIYCAKPGSWFSVVTNPSEPGASCGYNSYGFSVNNINGVALGLPTTINKINFLTQYFEMSVCEGASTILSPNDFQNYNWALSADPLNVLFTADSFEVSPTVDTEYIVYDGTDTAYFMVTVIPSFKIDLGPDITLCENENVVLTDLNNLKNMFPFSTYVWSPSNLALDSLETDTSGIFILNLLFGQCVQSDTVEINVFNAANLLINANNPMCNGTPTGSIIVNGDSTINVSNIHILDNSGNTVNTAGTSVANNLLGGIYYIESDSLSACPLSIIVELIDPPAIQLTLSLTNPPCYGDATGGATVSNIINYQGDINDIFYNWTPNTSGANGLGVTNLPNLTAGDYNIQVVDDFGCEVSQVFSIIDPNPLVGEVTDIIPTMCRTADFQSGNGVVAVQTAPGSAGTGSVNYAWEHLTNGQTVNTSTFVVRSPGQVALTITDGNGCIYRDTVQVDSINPISNFLIESDDFTGPADREGTEDVKVKITNLSENFAQANNPNSDTIFQWNLFSNQLPSADQNWFFTYDLDQKVDTTYQGEQIYKICLIAKNYNDCADTFCQEVIVHKIPQLITPNVFTPGSSPNNTFFFPSASIADFNCTVFNRYGVQVYEFKAITDEWDGSHYKSGNPCSDGTYFYVYKALSTNGTPFEGEGQVQLVGSE